MGRKREKVTKAVRFRIFKRDEFCCQYCGRTPPAVILEIDHVTPVCEGGDNNDINLVTSCFDCNRGKGSEPLTTIPASIAERMERLQEKERQVKAYQRLLRSIDRRVQTEIDAVEAVFRSTFPEHDFSPAFRRSVAKFIRELGLFDVQLSMDAANAKQPNNAHAALKYFCGICWRKIRGD